MKSNKGLKNIFYSNSAKDILLSVYITKIFFAQQVENKIDFFKFSKDNQFFDIFYDLERIVLPRMDFKRLYKIFKLFREPHVPHYQQMTSIVIRILYNE